MRNRDAQLHMKRLRAKRKSLRESGEAGHTRVLLPFYVRIMTKLADCERCSVFINDPDHDKIWLKAGTDVDEREIEVPKEGSVVGDVIASGKPEIIANLEAKPGAHKHADEITGFVTRNILCVPIKGATHDEIAGAFQLLNKNNGKEFTSEDLALATEVAEHLKKEIDAIYLDQEIFGFAERLYSSLAMARTIFIALIVLMLVALFGLLGLWLTVPLVMG
jgi:GAF domain-containing protein